MSSGVGTRGAVLARTAVGPATHRPAASGTDPALAPLEDGLRTIGRPELATVVLAVLRGLLMDLDATGDAERTGRAFEAFLETLRPT